MEKNRERAKEKRPAIQKFEQEKLVELLSNKMSGSELNTLFLEMFRRRSTDNMLGELLRHYKENQKSSWI
ncbi:hypothetical protein [Cohnella sp. GbtcB17]|uniref:hypothetical protein n=1 Tax=Cohnella sp. GbtcB17 TaxID=2824762 RepID=UPI001C3066F6|nr:hypothetical protein [Cohnella sp. GbtcB17]